MGTHLHRTMYTWTEFHNIIPFSTAYLCLVFCYTILVRRLYQYMGLFEEAIEFQITIRMYLYTLYTYMTDAFTEHRFVCVRFFVCRKSFSLSWCVVRIPLTWNQKLRFFCVWVFFFFIKLKRIEIFFATWIAVATMRTVCFHQTINNSVRNIAIKKLAEAHILIERKKLFWFLLQAKSMNTIQISRAQSHVGHQLMCTGWWRS